MLIIGLLIFLAGCGDKVDEKFLEGTWVSQNDAEGKIIFHDDKLQQGEDGTEQTYAMSSDKDGKFIITFQREETGGVETFYFQKESKNKIKVTRAVLDSPSDERLQDVALDTEYKKEGSGILAGAFEFIGVLIGLGVLFAIGYVLNRRS